MSHACFGEALESAERPYRRSVIHSTWGHLAPKDNTVYTGHILFTHGCHGDIVIIQWEFKGPDGEDLDASPWIYEHMHDFIGDLILPKGALECRLPEGRVYRWTGRYLKYPDEPTSDSGRIMREGEGEFRGRTRRIKIPPPEDSE